jgi:hypothetical protein
MRKGWASGCLHVKLVGSNVIFTDVPWRDSVFFFLYEGRGAQGFTNPPPPPTLPPPLVDRFSPFFLIAIYVNSLCSLAGQG